MTQDAARGVLVLRPGAGALDDATGRRLREAFADHRVVGLESAGRSLRSLPPGAPVVVAGGDGTIRFVAGRLADSGHPLGIIPLGTFNNFARALGLPTGLEEAIEVVRSGSPRPVTLGRVNGHPFLEVAAVGLFGEAIALGEAAKERAFGELLDRLRALGGVRRFRYSLQGDLRGEASALSLVFANTPSTGANIPVAEGTPEDPYLELSVFGGTSPPDAVSRFRRLEVVTRPRVAVHADAEGVGRTPARVAAEVGALRVILAAK